MRIHTVWIALLGLFIVSGGRCFAAFILAPDYAPGTLARNQGFVTERGAPGKLVAITWTGSGGAVLGTTPIMAIPAGGVLNIPVPKTSPDPNAGGKLRPVYDYYQFVKDGPTNYLDVESFVPSGSDFAEYPFIDYIALALGPQGSVAVPDLYADTDHDGGPLDDSDILYTAVNLSKYIPANVAFNPGDTFTITNGESSALPGMIFGTQPITLDASSPDGFSNPAPYTGDGTALTQHITTVIPEPSSVLLVGSVLAGMGLWRYRSRRKPARDL
jgi:hypothetical protein